MFSLELGFPTVYQLLLLLLVGAAFSQLSSWDSPAPPGLRRVAWF